MGAVPPLRGQGLVPNRGGRVLPRLMLFLIPWNQGVGSLKDTPGEPGEQPPWGRGAWPRVRPLLTPSSQEHWGRSLRLSTSQPLPSSLLPSEF